MTSFDPFIFILLCGYSKKLEKQDIIQHAFIVAYDKYFGHVLHHPCDIFFFYTPLASAYFYIYGVTSLNPVLFKSIYIINQFT